MNVPILLFAAAGALGGCATITEGTTQEIYVNIVPSVARCNAAEKGEVVGTYNPETMSFKVPKSKTDLFIACSAPGYKNSLIRLKSEASAWGVVGALTLDFGVVDYATGALNKYPSTLQIVMERETGGI